MKDLDFYGNSIQLRYNSNVSIGDALSLRDKKSYYENSILEPEIPLVYINKISKVDFDGDFDFITFSVSPSYTPKSADFIIDIIKRYLIEE